MKKMNKEYLFIMPVLLIFNVGSLMLTGCSGLGVNGASGRMNSAAATVDIRVGKVGVLAKRTNIEMAKLIVEIKIKDSVNAALRDTSILTGLSETVVKKTFPGLIAPETFTLHVKALDKMGKIIHSGSKNFSTIPADTVNVSLDLDAQYSMLRVSFNDIPDSVKMVSLGIATIDTLDSAFAVGSRDTIVLTYDYLTADTIGINHAISLRASGSFHRKDTVLFAADTTVSAASGVDKSYKVVMKWVGPGVPEGAATMTVTIGTVGTTVINAGFEVPGEVPTQGLVAYYPFNGNANDESIYANNGTVAGPVPADDRFGKTSRAYQFDGTNDYIDAPDAPQQHVAAVTVSVWIKPLAPGGTSFCSDTRVVFKRNNLSSNFEGFQMTLAGQNVSVTIASSSGQQTGVGSPGQVNIGQWVHLVLTADGSSVSLYQNGDQVAAASKNYPLDIGSRPLVFGSSNEWCNGFFNGVIDDVRIYNRILTGQEIKNLYRENNWTGNP